jgi:hypothetical protein
MRGGLFVSLIALVCVSGCFSGLERALLVEGSENLDCPRADVTVTSGYGPDRYLVVGCGRSREFHCDDGECVSIPEETGSAATWADSAVIRALRSVNSDVLACVPELEELEIPVHLSSVGRATTRLAGLSSTSDLSPGQRACVRRALSGVQIPVRVDVGRYVTFVFGGRVEGPGPGAALTTPPPPSAAPAPPNVADEPANPPDTAGPDSEAPAPTPEAVPDPPAPDSSTPEESE